MKKLDLRRLCGFYLSLMSSVFLLAVSPAGYYNIAETKAAVFCCLSGLFILLCVFVRLKDPEDQRKKWNAVHILVLAYWVWSLISALCSPWRVMALLGGDRFDGMIAASLYLGVFLLLSSCGTCDRFPFWLPAAALSGLCLVAILQFFDLNPLWLFPNDLRWSGREIAYNGAFLSLTGNADLTASVLCTGFGLLWPQCFQKGKRWILLPAAACLGVLIASGIRAGLLGALASVLICIPALLPCGKKGKRLAAAVILLVCLCALLLLYFLPLPGTAGELHDVMHGKIEDSFGSGRIYIWKNVWQLVKERPLLGGGPDTLGERGLAFVKTLGDGSLFSRSIDCAHSQPLNILVNQGIPALLFLAAALLLTLRASFRCPTPAASALRSALIAYLGSSLFDFAMPANAAFFWLIWGMLLAEIEGNQRFNAV